MIQPRSTALVSLVSLRTLCETQTGNPRSSIILWVSDATSPDFRRSIRDTKRWRSSTKSRSSHSIRLPSNFSGRTPINSAELRETVVTVQSAAHWYITDGTQARDSSTLWIAGLDTDSTRSISSSAACNKKSDKTCPLCRSLNDQDLANHLAFLPYRSQHFKEFVINSYTSCRSAS